jgi:hypothetical protein
MEGDTITLSTELTLSVCIQHLEREAYIPATLVTT